MRKNPTLMTLTLSNIFSMRLIGNKTHGDLAEVAISEFINQYMYDFKSVHVGKDLYRAKSREEDLTVQSEISGEEFPVSLKAYGNGPLQLSTDKTSRLFPMLSEYGPEINDADVIDEILSRPEMNDFREVNVLPLIYDERNERCNIMVFRNTEAFLSVSRIILESEGAGRKHPVFRFYDEDGGYVCEVRYGNAAANALQRGLWTNTVRGYKYFKSVTDGWVSYSHNTTIIQLLARALVCSAQGHVEGLKLLDADIAHLRSAIRP